MEFSHMATSQMAMSLRLHAIVDGICPEGRLVDRLYSRFVPGGQKLAVVPGLRNALGGWIIAAY
jgi:hypothetical protein